ncbi:MAG TPA: hypothetical protein VN786_13015 [Acidimicrobiales bacterium]|nr:hypothetical protein [Acidimicrobiales bacterium]
MSDIGSDYAYAEEQDNELLAEEDAMLEAPAPYEEQVAYEDPVAVAEELDANIGFEENTQDNFVDTFNSEELTDSAITGGEPVFIDGGE